MREWINLFEDTELEAITEKKKKHHHHKAGAGRGYGFVRGIYACPVCLSHIPSQHVGSSCPVCNTPVAPSGGDAPAPAAPAA